MSGLDWGALLAEFGLPGLVITGLVIHIQRVEKRQKELVDAERETQREVRQLVRDQTKSISDLTAAVKDLARAERGR